jgi:glycerol-3-phosphate dehydrogenase
VVRAPSVTDSSPHPKPDEWFDLIVVGAGINGAGIARDAALRGLRVLLLDKGDIASGTTSWSTRLIHGGLRYLEHGEIGLVRESLRERRRLLQIAPHLVQPIRLLIPMYCDAKRTPVLIRAGMLVYDALAFDSSLPRHRMLDRTGTLRRMPGLNETALRGAALYYDAQVTFAERLALENALDARDLGATVCTYHKVAAILTANGQATGVAGRDVLTGEAFQVRGSIIVNAAGPWVDEVLDGHPGGKRERLIGGTKGSHIVVGPFPGAPRDAVYAESPRDGRPFFIVPWNGQYLIGTTDTRYTGDLDRVVSEAWEIEHLFAETNRLLPAARLVRSDIHFSYAGVRPLPYSPGTAEGGITRRHHIHDHVAEGGPRGLYSIVGGKLTTYRELAEQTVGTVLKRLGRTLAGSRTADVPLPGGRYPARQPEFRERFLQESGLARTSAEHLLRVYGARAPEVLASATTPALREVFDPFTGAIAAEVAWGFQQEGARTLTDVIARRTMTGLGPTAGIGPDAAAARIAQTVMGWDGARLNDELMAYRRWVSRYQPPALERANSRD